MSGKVAETGPGRVAGVILAGGLSRRMGGGDKGLIDLGGTTMIAEVIERLRPQVSELVINANGAAERFAGFGLPVAADPIGDRPGPLAGVLAGMVWARTQNAVRSCGPDEGREITHIVTASSDAPFLPQDLVGKLAGVARSAQERGQEAAIVLARSGGHLHPVIGLWPVTLADDLDAALRDGVRKVLHWTDRHGTLSAEFDDVRIGDTPVDPFFNANTPEELDFARSLISSRQGT